MIIDRRRLPCPVRVVVKPVRVVEQSAEFGRVGRAQYLVCGVQPLLADVVKMSEHRARRKGGRIGHAPKGLPDRAERTGNGALSRRAAGLTELRHKSQADV